MTLRPLDLNDGSLRFTGLHDVEPSSRGGIGFHRLPAWARAQLADPAIGLLERMPAGGRLEVVTDATTIELDVQAMLLQLDEQPIVPAAFDAVVDGEVVASASTTQGTVVALSRRTTAIDVRPGGPATVRLAGLPAGEKHVAVWLPHAAVVDLLAVRLDGSTATAPPASRARRWIHYGSSISHCLEATSPTGAWPSVAARLAGVDLRSLGLAGQCQLDQFVARTIRDLECELVSLKLGINLVNADSMRERTFVPAVHGFLDTVRDGHPTIPLVVVTPITCPVAEDAPGPTGVDDHGRCSVPPRSPELAVGALTLRRIRTLLAEVVEQRVGAGDANLHLLAGPDLFGPGDVADLPDGLHPNAAGYQRMGERFHALAFGPGGPFAAATA